MIRKKGNQAWQQTTGETECSGQKRFLKAHAQAMSSAQATNGQRDRKLDKPAQSVGMHTCGLRKYAL